MGHDPYKDQDDERNSQLRRIRDEHAARTIRLSVQIEEKSQQLSKLQSERKELRAELHRHSGKWPNG